MRKPYASASMHEHHAAFFEFREATQSLAELSEAQDRKSVV
jgi:hypothetical protein